MPETIKSRDGRVILLPTEEEDRQIIEAALTDPDALPLTDEDCDQIERQLREKALNRKQSSRG